MDANTRSYIGQVADLVRGSYNIDAPIEDMESIVKILGGKVEHQEDLDELCDGTIQKQNDDSFIIKVSPFQNSRRKNFTIAHELGHLFLHMGYLTSRDVWDKQESMVYKRFGRSEQEYQANEFAANFLMPDELYKTEVEKNTNENNQVDMTKVAETFNVSLAAAINRGEIFGIYCIGNFYEKGTSKKRHRTKAQ